MVYGLSSTTDEKPSPAATLIFVNIEPSLSQKDRLGSFFV